jgi:succinate dehydrogenase / fumarate reductase cytochrome b subunit
VRTRGATAPRFLNLLQIRFPVGAITSIGHRISGALLFAALPLLATLLEQSLRGEPDYENLLAAVDAPWMGLLLVIATWAMAQHLLAGLRHLLMDVGIGHQLAQARASAWLVNGAALVLAFLAAVNWFL